MPGVVRRLSRYGDEVGAPLSALDAFVEALAVVTAERILARHEREFRDARALPCTTTEPYGRHRNVPVDTKGTRRSSNPGRAAADAPRASTGRRRAARHGPVRVRGPGAAKSTLGRP